MDLYIAGRNALVTGSSAGIGFAVARLLAHEGVNVTVNGRDGRQVKTAVQRLRDLGLDGHISGIAADLGTAEGCLAVVEQLPAVDILINNVGIYEAAAFEEISDEDWIRLFETNVLSGVRLARAYLAGMQSREWGRVVFISSESAVQIPKDMIHYGVTKTAQVSLARGLAETTKGTNVTVNSVLAGPTHSEGVDRLLQANVDQQRGVDFCELEKDFFRSARPSSLLQRFATVDEVASMVVYICSVCASATNGAALRVDGGVIQAAL